MEFDRWIASELEPREAEPVPKAEGVASRPKQSKPHPALTRQWIQCRVAIAQPAILFAEVPESFDCTTVLKEFWRALRAYEIRHRLDFGTVQMLGLPGLAFDPVDARPVLTGEAWRFVDQARGVLEHPPGVPRAIEFCLEDAQAHFRAWLLKQSREPVTESEQELPAASDGLPIKSTPAPKQGAGKKSSYLAALDNEQVRNILTEHGVPAGAPGAPVRVTADQAGNFWRWSKENAHQAAGAGTTIDTKTKRLRAAFKRCTEVVPDASK
jgi:hypothetical protein